MSRNDQMIDIGGVRETVTLAKGVNAPGPQPPQSVYGGTYVLAAMAGNWNGASMQVQTLGPDGVTFMDLGAPKTANDSTGGTGLVLGSNTAVRVNVTGNPTGLFATLSRVPN